MVEWTERQDGPASSRVDEERINKRWINREVTEPIYAHIKPTWITACHSPLVDRVVEAVHMGRHWGTLRDCDGMIMGVVDTWVDVVKF